MMKLGAAMMVTLALVAAGCEDQTSGQKGTDFADVRIGLLVTTGGKGGDLAGPSIGAANVAVSHLRRSGIAVQVEQLDYAGDLALIAPKPDGSPADAIADLAKKSEVIVVGTDDPAVLPALAGVQVPVIHAYVTKDKIAGGNVFRLAPSDSLQAKVLARFLVRHRKLIDIGIVHENTEFGTSGASTFEDAVTSEGGSVVEVAGFDTGQDLHTQVSMMSDKGAQAVAIWTDDPAEASRAVIDIHRSAASFQIAIPGNTAVPQFGKNAVAQVVPTAFREGIVSVGPWAGPWIDTQRIRRFYSDFEDVQNDLAPVRSAQVYDAVLLASAAKAKGQIATGLTQIEDFVGASVPVTFDANHEGMDPTDLWAWGFTKSKQGAGAEFFPAVDTGGGFFTLIPAGNQVPARYRYLLP